MKNKIKMYKIATPKNVVEPNLIKHMQNSMKAGITAPSEEAPATRVRIKKSAIKHPSLAKTITGKADVS